MDTLSSLANEGWSGRLVSNTIVKLLDDAVAAVDGNRSAAKDCITRAAALVRADRRAQTSASSPGPSPAPARLIRGGLAPWQARRVAAYIEAHLASKIQARDIIELTELSASYFFSGLPDQLRRITLLPYRRGTTPRAWRREHCSRPVPRAAA
jgi:hypothetical protein